MDDYNALADLFESIGHFIDRLEIYTEIPPTHSMNEIIIKILVELLSPLALATKELKRGKISECLIGEEFITRFVKCRESCWEASWREENGGDGPEAGPTDAS